MRTRLTPTLISLITTLLLALGLVTPAIAADPDERTDRASDAPAARRALAVHHGPVEVVLVDPGSDGHQLGDLRVTSVETTNAAGRGLGRLDATLTTTAIDTPSPGDEIRIGTLVFSFGDRDASQVVVQGSAHYPGQGSTIETGDSTVRPIGGVSGRFAGRSGSAVTRHLDDGNWVHYLSFHQPRAERVIDRALRLRVQERVRQWREQRKEAVAERRAQRQEKRAERKEAVAQRKAQRRADRSAAPAAIDELYSDAAADQTGVVRTDLGIAGPVSAPGESLGLWHYTIPAGAELAPHTHPGWQLARVTAGELEYSVISGEGELLRADGSSEPMGPGTYILASGDGVIENPDLVHFGANRGDDVVTIISATLFPAGEPIASLVDEPTDSPVSDERAPVDAEMPEASPAA